MSRRLWSLSAGLVAVVAIAVVLAWGTREDPSAPRAIVVPDLSAPARDGRLAYDRHCAECHGVGAAGRAVGPPLVHPVYRPAHHADAAFTLAVRRGVRAHHWRFGDMPPEPAVTDDEVAAITRYIRELQVANGIE